MMNDGVLTLRKILGTYLSLCPSDTGVPEDSYRIESTVDALSAA